MLPLICPRMQESELKGLGDQRQTNKGGFTRITSMAALVQSNAPRELKLDGGWMFAHTRIDCKAFFPCAE